MNIPYVKQYDDKGTLLNPINGSYRPAHPNRQQRRKKKYRFINNSKSYPMVIYGVDRYDKHIQCEYDKDGKRICIEHYIKK